jgi:4-cresol dehydrogenase (hydroxylating)
MTQHIDVPAEAIDRLRAVVGPENILVSDDERDQYRDPYWNQQDRTYDSSAVVFPTGTEQVQEIVRIADEFDFPVWTSSQGRNNGYGGPSPRVSGSVLISFRKMNRVLEINRELAYAVVEPGVRWLDLYEALQESGNGDLLLSVPDIGWGSVIGNSLDNGMTYLPYGSDYSAQCGLEVVLADGSLMRTGMGAIPDNKSWHLYKRGLGPVLDPLFMQSNFGVVTRMGVWLMRRPEAYAPLFLTVPRDEQLETAIDTLRDLRMDGVIRGLPVIQNTLTLASHFPEILGKFQGAAGTIPDGDIQKLADETGVGRWGMRTALWGDRAVVDHQLRRITEAWAAVTGGEVRSERIYARDEWGEITEFVEKVQAGIPSLDMLEAIPENMGHIGFSPVVPLVGTDVREVVDMLEEIVTTRSGTNFAAGIIPINDRACVIVSGVNFDVTQEEEVRRAYEIAKEMVVEAGKRGYGEYRAHIDFMDAASDQYSFNNHAYRRFVQRIKDAVDPRGVLSPGRHGIWPSSMRPAG